jgi:hypothetical protein
MTTLIIPDVHQDIQGVKKIFAVEDINSFDEIIFLGDWFDSFYEPPRVASFKDTCLFVRDLVWENNKNKKMVFLVGNHDLAYIYNNKKSGYSNVVQSITYWCSGVTKSKISTFRQVFYDKGLKDDWFIENFKIAHRSQGWIFSHAGMINRQIPYGYTVDQVIDKVLPDVWLNFRNVAYSQNALISAVGVARGGQDNTGGLLWLDYHNEFNASKDIGKQVFGHSYVPEPTAIAINTEYESWNLDTNLKDYAKIRDGRLTTYKIK